MSIGCSPQRGFREQTENPFSESLPVTYHLIPFHYQEMEKNKTKNKTKNKPQAWYRQMKGVDFKTKQNHHLLYWVKVEPSWKEASECLPNRLSMSERLGIDQVWYYASNNSVSGASEVSGGNFWLSAEHC